MPAPLGFDAVWSQAFLTINTTTETQIITSDLVSVPTDAARVVVLAYANVTLGAGVTSCSFKIYPSNVIGVGSFNGKNISNLVAGAIVDFDRYYVQERDDTDRVQYTFSLQMTGATGNSTVNEASIVLIFT